MGVVHVFNLPYKNIYGIIRTEFYMLVSSDFFKAHDKKGRKQKFLNEYVSYSIMILTFFLDFHLFIIKTDYDHFLELLSGHLSLE